jgi:HD-like signal output (HDOD) protein
MRSYRRRASFVAILSDVQALPQVLLEIIPLLDDPDVDVAEVAGLAGRDPGLTSRLLRLANSPAFQRRREATTVTQAIAGLTHRFAAALEPVFPTFLTIGRWSVDK